MKWERAKAKRKINDKSAQSFVSFFLVVLWCLCLYLSELFFVDNSIAWARCAVAQSKVGGIQLFNMDLASGRHCEQTNFVKIFWFLFETNFCLDGERGDHLFELPLLLCFSFSVVSTFCNCTLFAFVFPTNKLRKKKKGNMLEKWERLEVLNT